MQNWYYTRFPLVQHCVLHTRFPLVQHSIVCTVYSTRFPLVHNCVLHTVPACAALCTTQWFPLMQHCVLHTWFPLVQHCVLHTQWFPLVQHCVLQTWFPLVQHCVLHSRDVKTKSFMAVRSFLDLNYSLKLWKLKLPKLFRIFVMIFRRVLAFH